RNDDAEDVADHRDVLTRPHRNTMPPSMFRLAFSTNAFKKNTLDEAIDAIGDIGYAGVELMADLHHAYPPAMDTPRRQQTLHHLSKRRLPVSNVNAFTLFACGDTYHPTWIESDPARR